MIVNLAMTEHKAFVEALMDTLTHRLGPNWPALFFDVLDAPEDKYTLLINTSTKRLYTGDSNNMIHCIQLACTNQSGMRMTARAWDKHQKYYGSKETALEVQRILQKSIAKAHGKGRFFCNAAALGAMRYVTHDRSQVVSLVCHSGVNFNRYAEIASAQRETIDPMVLAILGNITNRAKAGRYFNAENDRIAWTSLVAQGATYRIAKSRTEPTPALVELLQEGTYPDKAEMPKAKKPNVTDECADEAYNNIMNRIHSSLEVDAAKYQKLKEQEAKLLDNLRALQDQQEVICKKWMQITGGDMSFVTDSLNTIVTYNKS